MKNLGLRDEMEDILITLGGQYHIIRPLRQRTRVFIYAALDRLEARLGLARHTPAKVEGVLRCGCGGWSSGGRGGLPPALPGNPDSGHGLLLRRGVQHLRQRLRQH